jgi:hypothetical protein
MGWVVIGLVRYIAKRFEGIWRRGESDEPIEGNPTQPNPLICMYQKQPLPETQPE